MLWRLALVASAANAATTVTKTQQAFAMRCNNERVVVWGGYGGGDAGSVADKLVDVEAVVGSRSSFTALRRGGEAVSWGPYSKTRDGATAAALASGVVSVEATESSFAGLKADGSVVAWGGGTGGDAASVAHHLLDDVASLHANSFAFTAVKRDGSVVSWGQAPEAHGRKDVNGGDASAVAAARVEAGAVWTTPRAFAARQTDGTVVAWGHKGHGGEMPEGLRDVPCQDVYANALGFACVADGAHPHVSAWGDAAVEDMGTVAHLLRAPLSPGVAAVVSTARAFAALRKDGRVVAWGSRVHGGNSTDAGLCKAGDPEEKCHVKGVAKVYSNEGDAFAAVRTTGDVAAWGVASNGGNATTVSALLTDVEDVAAARCAVAGVKKDRTVVAWGSGRMGGDARTVAAVLRNVTSVVGSLRAFAAVTGSGGVVTWGDSDAGGDAATVQHLLVNTRRVYATAYAFAAVTDGGVVAWGNAKFGGDASAAFPADLTMADCDKAPTPAPPTPTPTTNAPATPAPSTEAPPTRIPATVPATKAPAAPVVPVRTPPSAPRCVPGDDCASDAALHPTCAAGSEEVLPEDADCRRDPARCSQQTMCCTTITCKGPPRTAPRATPRPATPEPSAPPLFLSSGDLRGACIVGVALGLALSAGALLCRRRAPRPAKKAVWDGEASTLSVALTDAVDADAFVPPTKDPEVLN